ncbi:D-alanine--D-alanine ligase family protein [Liquorilactobacillus satsumensis]|uniref:D-alanine--D-alanine ligase n=1 Tax=Liquorilactobacillus satsumensis DSM 16230 = JCM 12392 TaxID=1423801 RepID=A0A0R1V3J4_9LACO|nr:D-alanine--D-alanine ligase family protein [Liquorilactobacillus satsumensis]KRL97349.1 D-alanyl-alanine synthetase A [Liquorilactobacillus satsumensis DSM 16230 = JCM 12392]
MNKKKLHVALFFGGNSSEHDVSKRSAHNIYDALDKDKYEVSVFMFTMDGYLLGNKDSMRIFDGEDEDQVVADVVPHVDFTNPLANIQNISEVKNIDVFFPVIHGNMGEDGTVQGLFRLLNKPWVGSGVASSGISFDKDLTKQLLTYHGIRNTKYVVVTPENQAEWSYEKCSEKLGNVLFVKPARQGSSVGIYKVENKAEFDKAIQDGFHYDFKLLVEESIQQPREVECSVLGNRKAQASKLGAIKIPESDVFYDYNNKFVDASGVEFQLPVNLPQELAAEITQMSLDAFRVLGNRGLARMDFLVDKDNVPYFGEVNTLPGFTNISLYPQLWEVTGIGYSDLLDRLIELAIEEFNDNAKLHYDFVELGAEKLPD